MSTVAETILPQREDLGLRHWIVAALVVLAAHAGLLIGFIMMRQSEMPPGSPPDAVMINLAPIPVAPPPQEEVETPPQPQQVQPETPPVPEPELPKTATATPVMPDIAPAPSPEAPLPELRPLVPAPTMSDLQQAPNPEVVMVPPPPPQSQLMPTQQQQSSSPPPTSSAQPETLAPPPPKIVPHKAKQKPQRARPRTNLPHAARSAMPTPGFNGEAAESWRSEIVERISSVKEYPEAARPASGTAVVAFSVDRSGRITSARLARSSGSVLLDQAAVATVRRANPVPPPPAGVPGGNFTIPLHFSG